MGEGGVRGKHQQGQQQHWTREEEEEEPKHDEELAKNPEHLPVAQFHQSLYFYHWKKHVHKIKCKPIP